MNEEQLAELISACQGLAPASESTVSAGTVIALVHEVRTLREYKAKREAKDSEDSSYHGRW